MGKPVTVNTLCSFYAVSTSNKVKLTWPCKGWSWAWRCVVIVYIIMIIKHALTCQCRNARVNIAKLPEICALNCNDGRSYEQTADTSDGACKGRWKCEIEKNVENMREKLPELFILAVCVFSPLCFDRCAFSFLVSHLYSLVQQHEINAYTWRDF